MAMTAMICKRYAREFCRPDVFHVGELARVEAGGLTVRKPGLPQQSDPLGRRRLDRAQSHERQTFAVGDRKP